MTETLPSRLERLAQLEQHFMHGPSHEFALFPEGTPLLSLILQAHFLNLHLLAHDMLGSLLVSQPLLPFDLLDFETFLLELHFGDFEVKAFPLEFVLQHDQFHTFLLARTRKLIPMMMMIRSQIIQRPHTHTAPTRR